MVHLNLMITSTLQRLALAAFIGPVNGQGRRGDKVDNLVYLALWCLARDWLRQGCGRRRPVPAPVGQQLKLHQEIARRLWILMSRQDKFDVLNGSGEMGHTHWHRGYLRSANDWMEAGEKFSLERITLPYGGEGYGQHRTWGECEECGIGLAVWRNCQSWLRHNASSKPLAWCLDCEEPEHLSAWEQARP